MQNNEINDMMDFSYQILSEDAGEGRKPILKIKGLFHHSDVPNGNKRVYPRYVLESAVSSVKDKIGSRQMLGELDHPAEGKIHLDKVSHLITNLEMMQDGRVFGEAEVFNGGDEDGGTPCGRILASLIKRNVKLGISSRGFGSVKKRTDINEVQNDYKLITFDIVSDPSTPNAYPQAMFEEKNIDTWTKTNKQNVSDILKDNLEN